MGNKLGLYGGYGEFARFVFERPTIDKKNLITGEGHGHYRPFEREKTERCHKQKKKNANKMAKQSRRRNRG